MYMSFVLKCSLYLILKFQLYFIIIIIFAVIQVDTAGWLQRTKQEKGAASLSIMQSRKSLLRAHIIALVLDAEEVYDLTTPYNYNIIKTIY